MKHTSEMLSETEPWYHSILLVTINDPESVSQSVGDLGFPQMPVWVLLVTLNVLGFVHVVAPNCLHRIWSVYFLCGSHGYVVYVLILFIGSMRSLLSRQFPNPSEEYVSFMKNLNTAFTIVFAIECVLKLIAYGLRVRAWCVFMLTRRPTALASFPLHCPQLSLPWCLRHIVINKWHYLITSYEPDGV